MFSCSSSHFAVLDILQLYLYDDEVFAFEREKNQFHFTDYKKIYIYIFDNVVS